MMKKIRNMIFYSVFIVVISMLAFSVSAFAVEDSGNTTLEFCNSVKEMVGQNQIVLPGFVPVKNDVVQIFDNSENPILYMKIEDKTLKTVECGLNADYTYKGNFDLETLVSLRDADDKVARLKEILKNKEGKVKGEGFMNSIKASFFKIGLKLFG